MVLKNAKSAITKDRAMPGETKNTYKHPDDILPISNLTVQR